MAGRSAHPDLVFRFQVIEPIQRVYEVRALPLEKVKFQRDSVYNQIAFGNGSGLGVEVYKAENTIIEFPPVADFVAKGGEFKCSAAA